MILRRIILGLAMAWWGSDGVAPLPAAATVARFAPAVALSAVADRQEQWLSRIVLDELRRTAATGRYDELAARLEAAMLARVCCGRLTSLGALNDMVYAYRACVYLPLARDLPDGDPLPAWLLEQKELSRRLFRALSDVKEPKDALKRFQQLLAAEEKRILAYPDLAVAFATSSPAEHYRSAPETADLLESFRWYTDPKAALRYDLKKMPYELSRYLADTRLSLSERRWAAEAYARRAEPARAYFDVRYDTDYYRKGGTKKISEAPYTLANLRRIGGVCIDQAYYASQVCKALGVPATIVVGRNGQGVAHAWLASLKVTAGARRAVWDTWTGRYESQKHFSGVVRDPASGQGMLDSELMLIGSAARLPLQRREEADTATVLARLVDAVRDRTERAGLAVLEKLADLHDLRFAGQKRTAKAATGWLRAKRKLDLALVEDLIAAAVQRNLAHRPAWELIVELRKADRLPVDDLDRFFDVLITRTAKAYPDYSCLMVMQIVPTVDDPARRESVYRKALGVYGRPDLQGKMLIALGDDFLDRDKKAQALKAYSEAARRCADVADVVLKAAGQAEALLLDAGRPDMALDMYKELFAKARKTAVADVFRRQTARYQLGVRLAKLLRQVGQVASAERVLAEIGR